MITNHVVSTALIAAMMTSSLTLFMTLPPYQVQASWLQIEVTIYCNYKNISNLQQMQDVFDRLGL